MCRSASIATTTSRQPNAAIITAPTIATTTVPTLPPLMWALIAKPRRSSGNCSASSPLPTGCCGAPPIRDTMFTAANVGKLGVIAWAANPLPNRIPPLARSIRRETTRVSLAKLSWTMPLANAPAAARVATSASVTWNSDRIWR